MANIAKDPQVALGRAIRLRREELCISQQELGLELGYDQGWISHIENGRTTRLWDRRLFARELAWPLSQLVIFAKSVEIEDRKPLDRPLREPRPDDESQA